MHHVGRPVTLPQTHDYEKIFMCQQLQYIMAISNNIGRLGFVVRKMCNPKWPEFKKWLWPWQTPQNRQDTAVTVFMMEFPAFISCLLNNKMFGTCCIIRNRSRVQKLRPPPCELHFHPRPSIESSSSSFKKCIIFSVLWNPPCTESRPFRLGSGALQSYSSRPLT